ncbi:MAG: hypothetical protein ACKKMO_00800 [Candidatus Nealsonbacteria bacterium]
MSCEICGKDSEEIVILPIKRQDGSLCTLACLECARKSPTYCKKHNRPHRGFKDGTSACIVCIEEMLVKIKSEKDKVWDSLKKELPVEELIRLLEWAEFSAFCTRDPEEVCILRAIITRALRFSKRTEEILQEIINTQSVSSVVPLEF